MFLRILGCGQHMKPARAERMGVYLSVDYVEERRLRPGWLGWLASGEGGEEEEQGPDAHG